MHPHRIGLIEISGLWPHHRPFVLLSVPIVVPSTRRHANCMAPCAIRLFHLVTELIALACRMHVWQGRVHPGTSESIPKTTKEFTMPTSVYCLATSESQADTIVDHLRLAGFGSDAISVLFPDKGTSRDFAHEKHTKAPEIATVGVSAGGVIGAGLGWLIGIGSLAIPGVGPFIAAGPIMAALGGAAVGATVGGISGALIGLGIPEYEAKRYEGKIRDGRILISVHAVDGNKVTDAKRVFTDDGAEDIATAGEASVPKAAKNPGKA